MSNILLDGLGGSPTITASARGNERLGMTFTDIGYVPPVVIAASYTVNRTNVVDLGAYDSATITDQPTHGRLIQRSDKLFSWDKSGINIPEPLDDTFTVELVRNGITESITRTFLLNPAEMGGGWAEEDYLRLDSGPDGRSIVEPPPDLRIIHIATDGLTAADIATLEGNGMTAATVTAAWLYTNKAAGQDVYYGETEALALAQVEGEGLNRHILKSGGQFNSWWRFYKRGQVFEPVVDGVYQERIADSRLHPVVAGAYGTGADPHFPGNAVRVDKYGHFMLRRDMSTNAGFPNINASWIATEDTLVFDAKDYSYKVTTQNLTAFGNSFRRIKAYDGNKPGDGVTFWELDSTDRVQGLYASGQVGLLVEDAFMDKMAWDYGYRANGDPAYPKPPEEFSHIFYMGGSITDLTMRRIVASRGSYSGIQMRPGGILEDILTGMGNAGVFNGQGPHDTRGFVEHLGSGNWSLVMDLVQTQAGFKDAWIGATRNEVLSQGYRVQAPRTSIDRLMVIDEGERPPVFASELDFGPGIHPNWGGSPSSGNAHQPFLIRVESKDVDERNSSVSSLARYGWSHWNQGHAGDFLSTGDIDAKVPLAVRETMTVQNLAQEITGAPGGWAEIADWLRGQAEPWDIIEVIKEKRLDPFFDKRSTRTAGQTCVFRPQGETPGYLADVPLDWSTKDLPGSFPGDSVDDDGHRVVWNLALKHPLEDYLMRAGGSMEVKGGTVRLNGSITPGTAGNTAKVHHGRLYTGGRAGGVLTVDLMDGRFLSTGDLDQTNILARNKGQALLGYEGSAFALGAGRECTLYGFSRCGFDGVTGAASEIGFSAGSTLRIKPTIRMVVTGMLFSDDVFGYYNTDNSQRDILHPRRGSIVRGVTSGAVARLRDYMQKGRFEAWFILDDMSVPFVPGEALTFDDIIYGSFTVTADLAATFGITSHGTVSSMEVALPVLKEWRSGMHGTNGMTQPNVASALVTNGNIHFDLANVPHGTYRVMEADSRTGSPQSVTASNNADKAITLAPDATGMTLTVASGLGQIN